MLCNACTRILRGEIDGTWNEVLEGTEFPHHHSLADLKAAVEEQRCWFCRSLWRKLSSEIQRAIESRCRSTEGIDKPLPGASLTQAGVQAGSIGGRPVGSYWIWFDYHLKFELARLFQLREEQIYPRFFDLLPTKDVVDIAITAPLAGSTGSDSALQQAVEWLRNCIREHKECNSRADRGPWNPTRLLDVGNVGDSLVRLVSDTHGIGIVRYLTLSHCWGKAQFIRLTARSAPRLQAGIAITALPKTFRDAVKVTRFLAIRYLWIDSLCIFQDATDLSDWTKEASLMDKVYAHGTLNISATAASDSLQGLFFERRSSDFHTQPVDIAFDRQGGRCSDIEPCYAVESFLWDDHITTAPVNMRAWVLQERLLAKRVLHFGQTQLFWECAELEATETFPDGLPKIVLTDHLKFKDNRGNHSDFDELDEHERKIVDRYGRWHYVVNMYTSAQLSNSQDRLMAIAGLAKEMNKQIQDDYVAGMWRGHLAGELLWVKSHDAPLVLRSHGYRAPSWSWASSDVEVTYPKYAYFGIRFDVNDVSLEYKSIDTFGLLSGGFVILTGILKKIGLIVDAGRSSDPVKIILKVNGRSVPKESDISGVHLDYQIPDNELVSENEAGSFFGLEAHSSNDIVALILLRVEDRESGVFSRIGIASRVEEPAVFRRMLERDEDEPSLPSMHWDALNRTHTIRVI